MTDIVKSEVHEARELIAGETFMLGARKGIYWAKCPTHRQGEVHGVGVWWPAGREWIESTVDMDAQCWIAMEIQAQDLRIGDYLASVDITNTLSHWAKVVEVQFSMGGVTLRFEAGSALDTMGLEEDRKVKVVRK